MSSRLLAAVAASVSIAAFAAVAAAQAVRSETGVAEAQLRPQPKGASGTPGLTFRSAFEGYRRYSDQPVGSWKEANDKVRQIGGWKTYARESQASQDASPSSDTESQDAASPAGGHSAHH